MNLMKLTNKRIFLFLELTSPIFFFFTTNSQHLQFYILQFDSFHIRDQMPFIINQ